MYLRTLPNHPDLGLVGVTDLDPTVPGVCGLSWRPEIRYGGRPTPDPRVELVLNFTNPRSHFVVTEACLEAGKHVYSEKPLAMELEQARTLVELAEARGLGLASAPCRVLGETAQTVWKALRERQARDGAPRLRRDGRRSGLSDGLPQLGERLRHPLAGQGRVRGRLHLGARRLLPDLAAGLLRPGADGDGVLGMPRPDKETDEPLEHNAPGLLGGLHHLCLGGRGPVDV